MTVYFNGEFLDKGRVCVSPDDRGFLLADGVYEVIASYGGRFYMAEAHFARLSRSLAALRIAEPDLDRLRDVALTLLARNDLQQGHAKLYLQITRGVASRSHAFPEAPGPPTVYATVEAYTPPEQLWARGVHTILVPDIRWARCDIKSLALLPNVLASQRAKEAGAYDAIFVRDGVITEGSHTSICAVYAGELITHPLTHHILGGVTRDVVLDLCRRGDIPYRERPIPEETLCEADEVMLLGTTTGVMPVTSVGRQRIGDGRPGVLTLRLQRALHARMVGIEA